MFRAKLSMLTTWVVFAGLCLVFPALGGAQTAAGGKNVVTNGDFSDPAPNSPLEARGWQGGRRVNVGGGNYTAEVVGPAGIMYQTLNRRDVAELLSQGKGLLTIEFEIVSPANRRSGLTVSLGGQVFNADDYRTSASNPGKVEIQFRDNDFRLLGDRTLSFQVKRPGARVRLDGVRVSYSFLGGGESNVVEPTPTPNLQTIQPPGSLGQYAAVLPYGTPTPRPPSSLDTEALRVSVNPPYLFVSPGPVGSGLEGTVRAAITLKLVREDGSRMSSDEASNRNAKVYFEYAGEKSVGSLVTEDSRGNVQPLTGAIQNLADFLVGASENKSKNISPKELYFVPTQVQDAEVRLLIRVKIDMPRSGETQNLSQPLELSRVVPISIRLKPGTGAKGNRAIRGLAPLQRFNRIFMESSLPSD